MILVQFVNGIVSNEETRSWCVLSKHFLARFHANSNFFAKYVQKLHNKDLVLQEMFDLQKFNGFVLKVSLVGKKCNPSKDVARILQKLLFLEDLSRKFFPCKILQRNVFLANCCKEIVF